MNNKLPIEDNLDEILKALTSEKYTDVTSAIIFLLNLNNPVAVDKEGFIFNSGTSAEVSIKTFNNKGEEFLQEILKKYTIKDTTYLRNYIKHKFTSFLDDKKKSNLGKYYTPEHLVELVHTLVSPYVKKSSYILDPAAGCGAFLESFKSQRIIGTDIDPSAVYILKALGFKSVNCDNSLLGVNRNKYGIKDKDFLVVVGNPPYNDVTSLNKKFGKNSKDKLDIKMDNDIWSQDYGISFLNAFNKIKADVICVLHPLSYLIKESNFNKLGKGSGGDLFDSKRSFLDNYMLKNAVFFSSEEFPDTRSTPFPIVAALYIRDNKGMDFDYIRDFKFKILNDERIFILSKIQTIDDNGYVRKYPPPKDMKGVPSDIGLYMYNIRDTNSLMANGNLTEKIDYNAHVTINFLDLHKYAYLNCMKRYFKKDFKFGNLSPIVDQDELESNDFLQDAMVIDTIMANQRLSVFDVKNKDSIAYKKELLNQYQERNEKYKEKIPAIYDIFLSFVKSHGSCNDDGVLRSFVEDYFENLKNRMIFDVNIKDK